MDPLLVYAREERIGRGSFGEVYLGRDKQSGQRVAIKVIDFEKTSDEIADIEREVALLSQCRTPYVTQYFGAYLQKTRLWIVMEYLGGGSALDLVESGTIDEPVVAIILRQMLLGLQYLHERRIVHSDVKAANLLFSEHGNVKLADLGIAGQLIYKDDSVSIAGSPYWMAPEVASSIALVFASDIWSFGITAVELATQKTPYSHLEPDQALFRIRSHAPPALTGTNWSEAFKEFVGSCLKKQSNERPTATSLLDHKFVSDIHQNVVPLALLERSARYLEAKRTAQNTTPSACNDATSQVTWTYPTLTSATVSPSPSLTVIQQSGASSLTIPATSSSTMTLRHLTPRCNASRVNSMLSCVSQRSTISTVSPGTDGPVEHFEPALLSDEEFQRALMEAEESASVTSMLRSTSERAVGPASKTYPTKNGSTFWRHLVSYLLDGLFKLVASMAAPFY